MVVIGQIIDITRCDIRTLKKIRETFKVGSISLWNWPTVLVVSDSRPPRLAPARDGRTQSYDNIQPHQPFLVVRTNLPSVKMNIRYFVNCPIYTPDEMDEAVAWLAEINTWLKSLLVTDWEITHHENDWEGNAAEHFTALRADYETASLHEIE